VPTRPSPPLSLTQLAKVSAPVAASRVNAVMASEPSNWPEVT
jgi:hypothetical protein